MKKFFYMVAVCLVFASFTNSFVEAKNAKITNKGIYTLELNRWNIYNNGTHATETTTGFNKALEWAH